jgi:hypothetical protein
MTLLTKTATSNASLTLRVMQVLLGKRSAISGIGDADLSSDVQSNQVHAVYPKITQEALGKMSVNEIINYDASRSNHIASGTG